MTAATETCPIDSEYAPDPREVLDQAKRAEIAVAIKLGCSRRMAADMAGCHHATIARTADRDPAFARQLNEAESGVDFAALKRIQEASAENKNWRAAAWVLERRHPEEFGRRTPHTFTGDQVMGLLAQIFDFTLPTVRKNKVNAFMREFNEAMREVESQVRRADRWRSQAGVGGDPRNNRPLRSPYEHPGWFDPDRRENRPDDDNQAYIDWLRDLSNEEYDVLHEEYLAKTGQRDNREEPHAEPSTAKEEPREATAVTAQDKDVVEIPAIADAADIPRNANAIGSGLNEVAAAEQKAPPAGEIDAAERPAVVEVVFTKRAVEPRQSATEERQPIARATSAAPTAAPPPPVLSFPLVPWPDGKPPTEEAHQAYRQYMEWLHGAAARKLVDINSLQQQALRALLVAVPVGGAQMGWQIRSSPRR